MKVKMLAQNCIKKNAIYYNIRGKILIQNAFIIFRNMYCSIQVIKLKMMA